jgi:hypothetical protein
MCPGSRPIKPNVMSHLTAQAARAIVPSFVRSVTRRGRYSMSVMIRVFVRGSTTTSPRGERNFLIKGASSVALA